MKNFKPLAHKSQTFVGDQFSFLYNTMSKDGLTVEKCQARLGEVVKFNADTFTLQVEGRKFRQFRWTNVLGCGERTGIMVA